MGTRWHERSCTAPDVIIDHSTGLPHCQSCTAFPHVDSLINDKSDTNSPPTITQDEPLGEDLGLFWPATVAYTQADGSFANRSHETVKDTAGSTGFDDAPAYQTSSSPVYPDTLRSNEFRLLSLSPPLANGSGGLVHADLTTFSHDDCPEYETVSYTWGGEDDDSTLCKPVFIGPYWDILLQTKNCWAMLKHMRPRSGERIIWVDAICINQSSSTERENQVAKMGRIYEEGLRVCVFLGEDVLQPIGIASYPARRNLSTLPLRSPLNNNDSSSPNSISDLTLEDVLRRRYFSRSWVVQELILAPQAVVRIGPTEYLADHHTKQDIGRIDRHWAWQSTAAPWFQHVTQRSLARGSEHGLLEILRLTWDCHCTDSRDRVFGVLGLIQPDYSQPKIRPDYSISAQHAFIGIFAHCLIHLGDIGVFSAASGIHHWKKYPSWVPAWKSTVPFPEPVDLNSAVVIIWMQKWQDDTSLRIDRGRFEMEQLRGRLYPKSIFSHTPRNEREGYHQKYYSETEAMELSARGDWSPDYRVVQFLPILWEAELDHHQAGNSSEGETAFLDVEPSWHNLCSVSAQTGALAIQLVRLLCIRYQPTLVSRMGSLFCYRVPSQRPFEDSKPNALHDDTPYLIFVTRTESLQDLIQPEKDHLFILDRKFSQPVFLILRETGDCGNFELVAPCEQIFFTHISYPLAVTDGIRLKDIRKAWNISHAFADVVSRSASRLDNSTLR